MMRKLFRKRRWICALVLALLAVVLLAMPALAASGEAAPAAEAAGGGDLGAKALAAGIAVGLAAAGGAIGMGLATAKTTESISRQPEADGKIRTAMMLGLVFIETAIIYALLVVILIIFVL